MVKSIKIQDYLYMEINEIYGNKLNTRFMSIAVNKTVRLITQGFQKNSSLIRDNIFELMMQSCLSVVLNKGQDLHWDYWGQPQQQKM